MEWVKRIHHLLQFESSHPQFKKSTSIGKIGLVGFILGCCTGCSYTVLLVSALYTLVSNSSDSYFDGFVFTLLQWSLYCSLLFTFHILEFLITALYQPHHLSFDSFVINHSLHYTMAFLASFVEFWFESILWGRNKKLVFVMFCGVCLMCSGQVIRTLAMYTCAENFSHLIMENNDNHRLVKNGIYSYLAHPSYFGWFYWSIGTQLVLCNPICTVLYIYASWSFFNERIPYEERILFKFYKEEYRQYRRSTIIGIPFISSPLLKHEEHQ